VFLERREARLGGQTESEELMNQRYFIARIARSIRRELFICNFLALALVFSSLAIGAPSISLVIHLHRQAAEDRSQPTVSPVNGILGSTFGGRSDPLSGKHKFHTGVDLEVPPGTPVCVTADGVVTGAKWSGAYGKLVKVDHGNGIETYYAHLSTFLVRPGQAVLRGQVIALSGRTGRVTGPHVHYEVRLRGTPVNPLDYLAKSQPAKTALSEHSDLGL
jgi:murein DD-endopeptidase MepM/ murein hydrolase activator NlpD